MIGIFFEKISLGKDLVQPEWLCPFYSHFSKNWSLGTESIPQPIPIKKRAWKWKNTNDWIIKIYILGIKKNILLGFPWSNQKKYFLSKNGTKPSCPRLFSANKITSKVICYFGNKSYFLDINFTNFLKKPLYT